MAKAKGTTTTKAAASRAPAKVVDAAPPPPAAGAKIIPLPLGDGLANAFTGMGTSANRRAGDLWVYDPRPAQELAHMYRSNWMIRKIVDILPDDMTQEWRHWQAKPEQITALEKTEKRLKVVASVRQALKWARLFGGSAIIVSDGRNMAMPLKPESLGVGKIKFLVTVPKRTLVVVDQLIWDPASEFFGRPQFFDLVVNPTQSPVRIHASRVIIFRGNPYPEPLFEADPFGDSVLQAVYEAVRDANIANSSGATLVEEAKIDIVQMENLEHILAGADGAARLIQRMQIMQLGKSTQRVVLMGGKETYTSKTVSFANVDKMLFYFMQIVSGAVDIPATRFLSQSPAGMSATGDSDMRNYSIKVKATQESTLAEAMEPLDRLIMRDALGDEPEDIYYEWASIWSQSPLEAAQTNYAQAQADEIYANVGVVPVMALEKAILNRLTESAAYPGLEEAMNELSPAELDAKRPEPEPIQEDPNKTAALAAAAEAAKSAPKPGGNPAAGKGGKKK